MQIVKRLFNFFFQTFNKRFTIRKLEKQVADCETLIERLEKEVAELEERMATPEGASDMKLYEQHQQLKKQISDAEEEWENVSLELEELKS